METDRLADLPTDSSGWPVGYPADDEVTAEVILRLPYPVSANLYWRNFNGRMVRSSKADAYKRTVKMVARKAGQPLLAGPVAVEIALLPKQNKDGSESKVRLDLDNVIKVTLDSLNGVAYLDDKQVERLHVWIGPATPGGGLAVSINQIAEVKLGHESG